MPPVLSTEQSGQGNKTMLKAFISPGGICASAMVGLGD